FFIHHPSTTDISTLSLHDALPISGIRGATAQILKEGLEGMIRNPKYAAAAEIAAGAGAGAAMEVAESAGVGEAGQALSGLVGGIDRKSTRLNSSHVKISYAVFCLK